MASVYRNPGRHVWMMRFKVKGKLVRLSSHTRSRAEAARLAVIVGGRLRSGDAVCPLCGAPKGGA